MTKTSSRLALPPTYSQEVLQTKNENTLAALLRAHTCGIPLVIIFNIEVSGHTLVSMSTVQGVFHCPRCSDFWKNTQKVLTICYEPAKYIQDPVVPLTVSDATVLTSAVLQWSKIFATDDLVRVFPLLKKALSEEERHEILYSRANVKRSNDPRSRFLVIVGGEKGPRGRVFPYGSFVENGNFNEGGPPVVARRLYRLDKLLYRKRAEEEFFRRFGINLSYRGSDTSETDFSLELIEKPIDLSPSASCSGDDGGFIIDIPYGGLDSDLAGGEAEEWARKDDLGGIQGKNRVNFNMNLEVSEDEIMKRKKVFQRIAEEDMGAQQSNILWDGIQDRYIDNFRRRRTPERPASFAIATIRSGIPGSRKGSFCPATSQRLRQQAINPCVWDKTGKPRLFKPSPLIKNNKLNSIIIVESHGDEKANANTKSICATLPLNEPERFPSAQRMRRQKSRDRKYEDIIVRKEKSKQLLQEKMRQYELLQLQKLQENVQLKKPLPTLASSASFSSAVPTDRTESCADSYQSISRSVIEDWKASMALSSPATETLPIISDKSIKKSQLSDDTQQTILTNHWQEKLAREYAALLTLQEQKSKFDAGKSPVLQVQNRAQYHSVRIVEDHEKQKRKTLIKNRLLGTNIINNDNIPLNNKNGENLIYGTKGEKNELTSGTVDNSGVSSSKDVETLMYDKMQVESDVTPQENINVSSDSSATAPKDAASAKPKMPRFVPALEQDYFRKSSLHSDFQPDSRFISNLTFTESYKFSYFPIPKHIKEHNDKIKTGNLWHPLQSLAKKQTVFRKERKLTLQESSMSIMKSLSSVSATAKDNLED